MNADRILDRKRLSGVVRHLAVEVVNAAEAVTAELEGVGCKEKGQAESVSDSSGGVFGATTSLERDDDDDDTCTNCQYRIRRRRKRTFAGVATQLPHTARP